jgi:hypothetical protein
LVPLCADQGFHPSDLKRSEWLRSAHTPSIKWSNPARLNEIRRLEKEGGESLTAARVLIAGGVVAAQVVDGGGSSGVPRDDGLVDGVEKSTVKEMV